MKKEYSTGEVSDILKISRVTVSRKFDAGEFSGRKNPITGERHISRESLLEFMRKYSISHPDFEETGRKRMILCSPDDRVHSLFDDVLEGRPIEVRHTRYGADALVASSQNLPDLIIVDEEVGDVSCIEIIRYLKRLNGIEGTRIISLTNSEIIADAGYLPTDAFAEGAKCEFISKRNLNEDYLFDKLEGFIREAELLGDTANDFHEHRRRHSRIGVSIPVHIEMYSLNDPELRETGTARMDNISTGGCMLDDIVMNNRRLPGERFRVRIGSDTQPLAGWSADGYVVRLHSDGALSAGIQYRRISERDRRRITEMIESEAD